MSTLQDFGATDIQPDEDDNTCEHDRRTLDEDEFSCFRCWWVANGGEEDAIPGAA